MGKKPSFLICLLSLLCVTVLPSDPVKAGNSFELFSPSNHKYSEHYSYQKVYPGDTVDTESIVLGLDAAMSGKFALSGVAIWRGMVLAVDEINDQEELPGDKLQVLARDHRANPRRGARNIRTFAQRDRVMAVMGGAHTPVFKRELPIFHKKRLIGLDPWAAGTKIVDNSFRPNYIYRLSLRDEWAGKFLVSKLKELGYDNPALLLERTSWGRSNHDSLMKALEKQNLSPAIVQWYGWGEKKFESNIKEANNQGADVIIFVGNNVQGSNLVKSLAKQPSSERLPVLSHWGILGGRFFENTQEALEKVDFKFIQTRALIDPENQDRVDSFIKRYCQRFGCSDPKRDIPGPVGTAHAYDLVHLLGKAVSRADTITPSNVRREMEQINTYDGLVRQYRNPFSSSDHEALTLRDIRLSEFTDSGVIFQVNPDE